MKIAFTNLTSTDQKRNKLPGIYPLITVNSSIGVQKSDISGQLLTYNNSSVIIDDNNSFEINKNKIFNNSIVTIKGELANLSKIKNIIENNSFFNIGSNQKFSELSSNYGGISKYDNTSAIVNYDFVWSSNLAYDYNNNTLYWQPYNKNAVFVNDINRIQIKVENDKFGDEYGISQNFLYNECLVNGFYKTLIFSFYQQENTQKSVSGFALENNKNIFKFEIPSYFNIACSSLITIKNMHLVTFNGLDISSIECINSNLQISNFNTTNINLSALNSNIILDAEITGYTSDNQFSSSIINTNIKINKSKLSYCPKYENTLDYFPGYSMLINPSGELLKEYTKIFSTATNGIITSLFQVDIQQYDLINYSLIEIYKNDKLYISGAFYDLKDSSAKFIEGTYILSIFKAVQLEQFFAYETYPYLGNRICSPQTITNSKRNNSYMYGLESHTHKYYNNINSTYGKGTLYPTQSINSHQRLSNSNTKTLLTQKQTCSYYQPKNSFLDSYIPQRSALPIGSIINFYQVFVDDKWLPQIPRGYYMVTTREHGVNTLVDKTIAIDTDNPCVETFNGEFVKIYEQNVIGTDTKLITVPSYPDQPDGTDGVLDIANNLQSTHRLIKIIKYAEKEEINE